MKIFRFFFNPKFLGAVLLVLLLISLITRFFSLQMSEKAIAEAFENTVYEPQHRFLNLGNGHLHYVTVGDSTRPPLLLIHGSPGNWDNFVPLITETDILQKYYIIAVDRPGYGQSGLRNLRSLPEQSKVLGRLVKRYFCSEKGFVMGHSYGGALSLQMVKENKERVRGVVLIAGTVAAPYQKPRWYNYLVRYTPVKWLISADLAISNEEMWQLQYDLINMEKGLDQLSQKIALLQGKNDFLVDPRSARFLAEKLPAADVHIFSVQEMDHFAIWTDKEFVFRSLEWVSKQ